MMHARQSHATSRSVNAAQRQPHLHNREGAAMQHGSAPVRHRRLPGRGKTQAIACSPVFMPAALAVIDTLLLRFKFPNRVALGFATMQREYSLYLSLVQGAPIGLQAAA